MARKNTKTQAPSRGAARNTMWGGRYKLGPAEIMEKINASIGFDKRLYAQDIAGSMAHADMLVAQKILTPADGKRIKRGCSRSRPRSRAASFKFSTKLEDIHFNVESRLTEMIGPTGGRLHTARSRNDQVALDVRLWVRDTIDRLEPMMADLQAALIDRAEEYAATIMPGFTHLQTAQPITFGHHLLAYVEMFGRDRSRFADCRARLNESPLGAAALAGSPHPIDPRKTAKALGFDGPMANSLDAVSDRDYRRGVHLRRLAHGGPSVAPLGGDRASGDSAPFRFIALSDAFTTGSSIMPQKRNPDAAELIARQDRTHVGAFVALCTMLKGLPLTYGKDMQEDKEPLFDAADSLELCLAAMSGMVRDLKANQERMRAVASADYSVATDLADWLVREVGTAVPPGPSRHGRAGRQGRGQGRRSRQAVARGDAGGRAAHHQGRLSRAHGRGLGRGTQDLWAARRRPTWRAPSRKHESGFYEFLRLQEGRDARRGRLAGRIADKVGTPFYCYSAGALRAAMKEFNDGMKGMNASVCYAMKANSNQAVIKLFADMGAGADIVSEGEMKRALAAGVPAKRIIYSGVGKKATELMAALQAGVGQINVESAAELETLNAVAGQLGKKADITIRVNPDVDAKTHAKITTGKKGNKFGIDIDLAREAFAQAGKLPNLRVVGIAMHIGSQLTTLEPYRARSAGSASSSSSSAPTATPSTASTSAAAWGLFTPRRSRPRSRSSWPMVRKETAGLDCELTFEPGRRLVGEAGVLVGEVILVKPGASKHFVIVDVAMNDLIRPTLYEAWHDILPVRQPRPDAATIRCDVVGPICELGDYLALDRGCRRWLPVIWSWYARRAHMGP